MTSNDIRTQPHPNLRLPAPLEGLGRLATNLYWSWHPEAADLFRTVGGPKFDEGVAPVQILAEAKDIARLAEDSKFLKALGAAVKRFDAYMAEAPSLDRCCAYYCAEYGLHESFAQYCGGLGILAGDHCKEASDLAMPFVAIGCFYRLGFFRQTIDADGRQQHLFPPFDPDLCPLERVLDPKTGHPLTVQVAFPGRDVHIAVWKAAVGRTPLLLLDTDLPENRPEDRPITAQLYMLGRSMRFHQETVLGVGGTRVLAALGIEPAVSHMNEGHSALLLLEKLRVAMAEGATWSEAREQVRTTSILTIHTPVPAGNERFDAKLVKDLLAPTLEGTGVPLNEVLKLGLDSVQDKKVFDMTAFALRLSRAANGVAILHGQTADGTWRPVTGKPVGAVTNGVHMGTWLGRPMRDLLAAHGVSLHPALELDLTPQKAFRATWEAVAEIPEDALWRAHLEQKQALVEFARARALSQHTRYGKGPAELAEIATLLDPDAFVIGFARRVTAYKRPTLLLSQLKAALALLGDTKRPVQVVFSGKAHPADTDGQAMVKEIFDLTRDKRFYGKVFQIEDYDMAVGRAMTQGVDLWINNPLRPLEASGTSGMKAAANGVPNASILDGWWDEGYIGGKDRNGWQVGQREPQRTRARQDKFDAADLHRVLSEEVLPTYWKRDKQGVPSGWVKVMRRAIATSLYAFSTRRMLEDYAREMYWPK